MNFFSSSAYHHGKNTPVAPPHATMDVNRFVGSMSGRTAVGELLLPLASITWAHESDTPHKALLARAFATDGRRLTKADI